VIARSNRPPADVASVSPLRAVFRCFGGCAGEWPLEQAIYRCPTCGGLLAVQHDVAALSARHDGAGWREVFDARYRARDLVDGSGVWSKREWVAPDVPTVDVVTTGEGGSPLFPARRLGAEVDIPHLFVKQCGASHTGSFKDLGMTVLVSVVASAIRQGRMTKRTLACASTGDTSAALAAYGALAGMPVAVLLPRGLVSTAQLVQPIAHGARVLSLDTDFDGCMKVVQELAARDLVYLANSMNPLRIEGQKTVAFEVAQQLGWDPPEWIVLPSGNLGNAAALHAGFAMMKELGLTSRMPRLCVAQAENANPMYRAFVAGEKSVTSMTAKKTVASAIQIGAPVSAPRALRALEAMNGVVEQASEDELSDACARADRAGLYTCPHTGVALAAAFKLRAQGLIKKADRVVVVSTANALKFTEFKVRYHEGTLADVSSRRANHPVELPADVAIVAKHLATSAAS
jgi:threonine synthase